MQDGARQGRAGQARQESAGWTERWVGPDERGSDGNTRGPAGAAGTQDESHTHTRERERETERQERELQEVDERNLHGKSAQHARPKFAACARAFASFTDSWWSFLSFRYEGREEHGGLRV